MTGVLTAAQTKLAEAITNVGYWEREVERYKKVVEFLDGCQNPDAVAGDIAILVNGGAALISTTAAPPPAPETPVIRRKQNEPGSKSWKEGYEARKATPPIEVNPNTKGTVSAEGWDMGWEHADQELSQKAVIPVAMPADPDDISVIPQILVRG